MLGIDSDAPGFARVKIEPHLGPLKSASGEIPHPAGKVSVSYAQEGNKWRITINLPRKTTGFLVWKGNRYELKGGTNRLQV